MKVEKGVVETKTPLRLISIGECFLFEGELYLHTDEEGEDNANSRQVVRLKDGLLREVYQETAVIAAKAKVVYDE